MTDKNDNIRDKVKDKKKRNFSFLQLLQSYLLF